MKVYIQPAIQAYRITPVSMICGSGTNSGNIPGGSTGGEPTPSEEGIIITESKPIFKTDFGE